MDTSPKESSPLRHWSALVPLGMSLAGLGMVLFFAAFVGVAPHADEGAPARIFQLLMLAQLPIAAYFAITWLPRRWRQALIILMLQGIAWIAALGAVVLVEGAGR